MPDNASWRMKVVLMAACLYNMVLKMGELEKVDPMRVLLSRWPLQKWWHFLNWGALGVGSAFFLSILFTYNWQLNPVLWRVFSPKAISIGPGDHHALIMLLFGVVFWLTAYLGVNPLLTLIGVFFYVESYEAVWYGFYAILRNLFGGPFEWGWMLIVVNVIPAFIAYVYLFGFPWKYFAWMLPMFVGWAAIGFPITNDFPGPTAFYLSISVNSFEILTHLWVAVGFFLFIYPSLQKSSDKIKMPWVKSG